jgi:hypothetical protein
MFRPAMATFREVVNKGKSSVYSIIHYNINNYSRHRDRILNNKMCAFDRDICI